MGEDHASDPQLARQVEKLLARIRVLLEEISNLRGWVTRLTDDLTLVAREYEQKLGALNAEARRLEQLRDSLLAEPAEATQPLAQARTTLPVTEFPADVTAPFDPPEARRKRELVAHVRYFTDDRTVIEHLNILLNDPRRDLGDLLELLPWGELWSARQAEWETLARQYARLTEWDAALRRRQAYWQQEVTRVEQDPHYSLLQRKMVSNPQEWHDTLEDLARRQNEDNARLAHEVSVLKRHSFEPAGEG